MLIIALDSKVTITCREEPLAKELLKELQFIYSYKCYSVVLHNSLGETKVANQHVISTFPNIPAKTNTQHHSFLP